MLALEHRPREGIPRNPAALLTKVAKNRALNRLRRTRLIDGKHRELAIDLAELEGETPDIEAMLDEDIYDDLLPLIFTACHPVLPAEQRAALALRLLGGLTTPKIARAYLLAEATVAQRIVRAKRALRGAAIPFETPRGEERRERLAAVPARLGSSLTVFQLRILDRRVRLQCPAIAFRRRNSSASNMYDQRSRER